MLAPRAASKERGARRTGARSVASAGARGGSGVEGLAAGEHALRAPTSGVFYGRPDPASLPFVSPGSSLEAGQTAGLIEVMKCFNPILHPGGTVPSPAVVARILVREGEEVSAGQILVVVRAVFP